MALAACSVRADPTGLPCRCRCRPDTESPAPWLPCQTLRLLHRPLCDRSPQNGCNRAPAGCGCVRPKPPGTKTEVPAVGGSGSWLQCAHGCGGPGSAACPKPAPPLWHSLNPPAAHRSNPVHRSLRLRRCFQSSPLPARAPAAPPHRCSPHGGGRQFPARPLRTACARPPES